MWDRGKNRTGGAFNMFQILSVSTRAAAGRGCINYGPVLMGMGMSGLGREEGWGTKEQ